MVHLFATRDGAPPFAGYTGRLADWRGIRNGCGVGNRPGRRLAFPAAIGRQEAAHAPRRVVAGQGPGPALIEHPARRLDPSARLSPALLIAPACSRRPSSGSSRSAAAQSPDRLVGAAIQNRPSDASTATPAAFACPSPVGAMLRVVPAADDTPWRKRRASLGCRSRAPRQRHFSAAAPHRCQAQTQPRPSGHATSTVGRC